MKRAYLATPILIFALFLFSCQQQEKTVPSPPTNLSLGATSYGVGVILSWEASSDPLDGYIVYFKALGQTDFKVADTVTGTSYQHNPNGETGYYYVTAYKSGAGESDPSEQVSTVPISTGDVKVYEFDNPAGPAGYGWDRTVGTGGAFSMSDTASVSLVDLYVTDDAVGQNGPYYFYSPSLAPQDGGVGSWLPQGAWKESYFKDISPDIANGILPAAENNYVDGIELTGNSYYAVNTSDNHYAAVLIDGEVGTDGTVQIKSWFQKVPGLRLIGH